MPPTSSAQALGQLQTAQQSAQDPNAILSSQRQALGVDAAQQTVTGLQGAIDNTTKLLSKVAPSVMGRTANSLVTNAQATKQIGNEQAPIQTDLGNDTTKYNEANSDLTTKEQEAKDAASGIYQGQQDKLSYAQNLYNTLYKQEQDTSAAQAAKDAAAEQQREFNVTQATTRGSAGYSGSTSTNNPAAGYSVKQLSSGNKAYTGPNGQTNLYQYASALAGGDPTGTFQTILSQLASGSPTDKGAYNAVKNLPMDKAITYLQQHNGYIFS